MARPNTGRKAQTISFENEVLAALKAKCARAKTDVSRYVNALVRHAVMSEYEYYRQLTRQAAAEFAKAKFLMESAPDKPAIEVRLEKEEGSYGVDRD